MEGEDDPVTLGGSGGTRAIELDLSLNPNPGGQGRGNLPPLARREPSQRRRRQRQARMEEFEGVRGGECLGRGVDEWSCLLWSCDLWLVDMVLDLGSGLGLGLSVWYH